MNVSVGSWRGLLCGMLIFAGQTIGFAQSDANHDLLKMVVELLGEKDKDLRSVGLEQVRTAAKGEAATKQFAAQLPKLVPTAQVGLLSALADRGDAAARPAILELLSHSKEESVREAALLAIGKLGDSADAPLLLSKLESASALEQAAASVSLARLRGNQVNAEIITAAKKSSPALAATLIKILATRRAEEAVPQLLQSALHEKAEVRSAAMAALAELAEVDAVPGLLRGVLQAAEGEERDAAEKAVVTVCAKNPSVDARVEPVLKELPKFSDADQIKLLSVVARIGGAPAYQLIEKSMQSTDAARSSAGWKALGKWPDATIAPKLLELARTSKEAEQRSLSLRAYVRAASMRDARSDKERLESLKLAMTLAANDDEKNLILSRCRTSYTIEALRFVLPYFDQTACAQTACETAVELAHHREIREPNKAEFDPALDRVMKISTDAVVRERAQLYKNGQTWSKPATTKKAS